MNYIAGAIQWILDGANWGGPSGIAASLAEHVGISLLVLVIASVIAIPVGYLIGHTGKGRGLAVGISGALRALPTLGLLVIVVLAVGIGLTGPLVALVVLAIPSILAGAYAGFEAIDRRTIDAARAVGMTELQIVGRVEVPLGLPLLIGGLRSATLQIIATTTLADYVGAGGLGGYIFQGVKAAQYDLMVAGSLLVIVLALLSEVVFSILQRVTVPRGVVLGQSTRVRARPSRRREVVGTPIREGK